MYPFLESGFPCSYNVYEAMDNVLSIAFCFWRCYARGRRQIHLCIFAFCLFLLYQRIYRKGLINMSLLEIDGLTHSFGENVLYKNAGFTLNKGEHIGIVGQNGTGKSTLIKICTEQIIPVADGLFCREIDGLFCRSSPDIIVRRRCVLSHKRRGWLQPSPSFRYSRNLALQDELYHPVINNGPAVLVCVDKRLGTGPVNQSRDAG